MSGLFNDYIDGYDPCAPSCADCIYDARSMGWKLPDHCKLLGREVDRVIGRCSQLTKIEAKP